MWRWNNAAFKETLSAVRVKMKDVKKVKEHNPHAITGYDFYSPPPNTPGGTEKCFISCLVQIADYDPKRDKNEGYQACLEAWKDLTEAVVDQRSTLQLLCEKLGIGNYNSYDFFEILEPFFQKSEPLPPKFDKVKMFPCLVSFPTEVKETLGVREIVHHTCLAVGMDKITCSNAYSMSDLYRSILECTPGSKEHVAITGNHVKSVLKQL